MTPVLEITVFLLLLAGLTLVSCLAMLRFLINDFKRLYQLEEENDDVEDLLMITKDDNKEE